MQVENNESLTKQEAAELANITVRTLENWIKDDLLKVKKGIRHGRRRLLILKSDLKAIT